MKLAFDTGGTFTDFALLDDNGRVHVYKVLSTPADPSKAVLAGIDALLTRLDEANPEAATPVFGATTLVTNAVLERKGARVALITTKGFEDVLRIRTEARYDLYDLQLVYPAPLVSREFCFGVTERIGPDGAVIVPIDECGVRAILERLRDTGIESVAVCLLHSYKASLHERRIGELIAHVWPGVAVSLSSVVCPEVREYDRASTTVVNAYSQPVMRRHVAHLSGELQTRGLGGQLFFMTSSGGVVPHEMASELPVRLIESGPAAGALAAAEIGRMIGEANVLSFDMGGTTAKLCIVKDGRPRIGSDLEVARHERFKQGSGFPLKIQSVQMIEMGAGGGSIARVDQLGLMQVGPLSAGADPGPACYGAGGVSPTVTDADLLLGYLDPDSFLGGEFKLDRGAASAAVTRLASELGIARDRCAWGIHDLVNENMSKAAAMHVLECGADARVFTLVAFGGAGPVHAYGVAKKVGIRRIVCPSGAGVTSAIGLLVVPVAFDLAISFPVPLKKWDGAAITAMLADLARRGREVVGSAGVDAANMSLSYSVDMRHVGQGHEINVPLPNLDLANNDVVHRLTTAFYEAYENLYKRRVVGAEIEAITWRLRVAGPKGRLENSTTLMDLAASSTKAERSSRRVYFEELGGFVETRVYNHYALEPESAIEGPAIIEQRESTAVVGPGASASLDQYRNLIIRLE